MAEQEKGNIRQEYNNATTGLNLDQTLNQITKGKLTYALNAAVENFDANSVNYQNEPGNELCVTFPSGFVLIGTHFIQEKAKHIFFITNPETGDSQIGYMENNDCVYRVLVNAPCLNFNINYPVHKMVHKITNCTTEIYWTDGLNPRRYLDIDNIPKILKSGTPFCDPQYTDDVDCNQLRIQPNFKIPQLEVVDVTSTGNLIAGTYQFAIQYSDPQGNPYTSYYSVTNPTPIADEFITSVNFNYPVGKSIILDIFNLEDTGLYQYFNLAVIKTVNAITSVELVGTYYIDNLQKQITYTGQNVTQIRLSINDIFEKFPYYDVAQDITNVQDVLVWDNLTSIDRINYQSVANQIQLLWESWRIPATENYADELNATNLRGYLRDEVYAFEIVFLLKNGKQTDGFHIPGRVKGPAENLQPDVPDTNPDFIGVPEYTSGGIGYSPYWEIYNTGSVIGTSAGYSPAVDYKGPYQYGEFGYWQSTETYPCNTDVWGDLSGQPIRHHKFPDINVSASYESKIFTGPTGMVMGNDAVFPIGVRLDVQQVSALIQSSNLTQEQKDDIVAFKIIRADRGTNKSIVAKGILRNVNTYEREEELFFYPNYPYNDLKQDPFLNTTNNAYAQICDEYTVFIDTLGADPTGGPDFAEIEFTNCNNGKITRKRYFVIGPQNVCSIGKPVILGPATGRVGLSTYELWTAQVCDTNPLAFARGGRIEWNDIYTGVTTAWVAGWPTFPTLTLYLVPGTGGPVQIEGPGDICFTGPTLVTGGNCRGETPQPGVTEKYRQIFNSPETSFGQPFLGGILKLESVMFGSGRAHFVEVRDNAKYKLLTEEAQRDALESAEELGDITTPFNATAMFTAYQAYLTIYVNGITRKNYAYSFNSTGDYNYGTGVPDNQGVKQRTLDIARYLIPGVQNVGDIHNINNFQRESSVYLRTDLAKPALPFPDNSPNMLSGGLPIVTDDSRFTISEKFNCDIPAKEEYISVVSYYASIKNVFVNQYGQIYSYETVDTGFQSLVDSSTPQIQTIFGGDTFISRFAFKTKLPFFIDNRVNAPDDSDIFYDEIGNIAYPKYWHSARSILKDYTITGVGVLSNIISYKAHNFDCPNSQFVAPLQPKDSNPGRTFYDGYFYMFAYGIPNFYCESSYNVDLRQAFNNREGDFWPHVSTGIPDDWVQQSYVPIIQDNTYYYNVTYSKQNRENTFTNLPIDWDKPCYTYYPFRAIYSDAQNIDSDNRVNSWLIYRAASYFDFPQNYGDLTSLDGIQNKAVLARFENKTLMYNNLLTIDTSNPQAAYVGNPRMFENPPIDFAETDLGYVGSQNKMLLRIPQGQITVDAKRGQVFLITGTQAVDLSGFGSGMNRFFTDHLAFEILRYFSNVPTDNHFNGIGLHGVFDSKYDRVIITKLDYIPLRDDIKYDAVNNEFYIETQYLLPSEGLYYSTVREVVYITDPTYFCNKSWTVSFNFNTRSWISFHSYLPNWYIGENNFFYSGVNGCCEDITVIAGVPEPIPTTTTTSTSSTSSTTTTTTTTTPIDCTIEGIVVFTNCTINGTAVIIIGPPDPPCERPSGLIQEAFFTGYNIITPPSTVVSTGSSSAACNAVGYLNTFGGSYVNVIPTYILIEYQGLYIGSEVYVFNGSTDCELAPDGWYFTDETQAIDTVIHVSGGQIVEILLCSGTTTTTSTSSTTTTSTSTTSTSTTSTSTTSTSTTTSSTTTTTTTEPPLPPTTTTTTTVAILCEDWEIINGAFANTIDYQDCSGNFLQLNLLPEEVIGCFSVNSNAFGPDIPFLATQPFTQNKCSTTTTSTTSSTSTSTTSTSTSTTSTTSTSSTTTTTTTLAPVDFTESASCVDGSGQVLADNYTGGSGIYDWVAIGTSQPNAISYVQGVGGSRYPAGTSYNFTSLVNDTYYVALLDSLSNIGVTPIPGILIDCTTTTTTSTTSTSTSTTTTSTSSTTTTTTTLAPVEFNAVPNCVGGTGEVFVNSYTGGNGSYEWIAIATTQANAVSYVNGVGGSRFAAFTSYTFTSLSNANYYVALRDTIGNLGVTPEPGINIDCTTTTTTTSSTTTTSTSTTSTSSTTTTTTTLAPIELLNSAVVCTGVQGSFTTTASGGTGVYSWIAIDTTPANVVSAVNGVGGTRYPFGPGSVYSWTNINNGTWYVAVKDNNVQTGVSPATIVNCTTTTTSTSTSSTTTTTTTEAPPPPPTTTTTTTAADTCTCYQVTADVAPGSNSFSYLDCGGTPQIINDIPFGSSVYVCATIGSGSGSNISFTEVSEAFCGSCTGVDCAISGTAEEYTPPPNTLIK